MGFLKLTTALALLSTTGWAQYTLQDDYMSGDFFSKFSFFDGPDPTQGFVQYTGENANLINSTSDSVYIGVDSSSIASNGRPSIRITSTESYQEGLVILDLAHMPGSICGTWPAFWMVGPNWPSSGEIDIIEGVNDNSQNAMTLHTGPGCSINSGTGFSGSMTTSNCDINAAGQAQNTGCGIKSPSTQSYGNGFNANGGGVYATEITSSYIAIYFFPRNSIPSDVNSGSPNPANWGTPVAKFEGSCDIPGKFLNLQIVFDITFCGSWAGSVWPGSSCAASTGTSTCEAYVANNPSAFADAYWSINALKVYSGNGGSGSSPTGNPWSPGPSSPAVVSSPTGQPWSPAPTSQPVISSPTGNPWSPAPTSQQGASSLTGHPWSPAQTSQAASPSLTGSPWSPHSESAPIAQPSETSPVQSGPIESAPFTQQPSGTSTPFQQNSFQPTTFMTQPSNTAPNTLPGTPTNTPDSPWIPASGTGIVQWGSGQTAAPAAPGTQEPATTAPPATPTSEAANGTSPQGTRTAVERPDPTSSDVWDVGVGRFQKYRHMRIHAQRYGHRRGS